MIQLDKAHQQIQHFKSDSLRTRIVNLERQLQGIDRGSCETFFAAQDINTSLLIAALLMKKASSQINEVVHALGIMLSLPYILRDQEVVEYVSLGAGNTGRPFDLKTNFSIAEFKFTDWKGGSETIRQNQLFKDFYLLNEYDTEKERYLYFVGAREPLKFFNGKRALSSIMSRNNKLWVKFQQQYGTQFTTVSDYYHFRQSHVKLVDLAAVVPFLT